MTCVCIIITYPFSLHVFDPLERLSLWIDHQRPPATTGHYDTVLRGEPVAGQTLDVPVSHSRRFNHEVTEIKVWAARHT